jgi:hypothetical protein
MSTREDAWKVVNEGKGTQREQWDKLVAMGEEGVDVSDMLEIMAPSLALEEGHEPEEIEESPGVDP